RPYAFRPPSAPVRSGCAAGKRRTLGVRSRRPYQPSAEGWWPVSDRGLERRARAHGAPRTRARGADAPAADRAPRRREALLVAGQPRAEGDDRPPTGRRAPELRDRPRAGRPRGRVARGPAADDGERGSGRPA